MSEAKRVELCERLALDLLVLPILHDEQRFVGQLEPCACGEKHLNPPLRVAAVRSILARKQSLEAEVRALKSQLELVKEKA